MTGENPDNYSLCLLRRDNPHVVRNGLLADIFYRGRIDFFVAGENLVCFDGALGDRQLKSSGQLVFSRFRHDG